MKSAKDIAFNTQILDKLILEKCLQIPGIDSNKSIDISYQNKDQKKIIDIRCYPSIEAINLYTLCLQMQKTIYNYLLIQFDLDPSHLEVNVYLVD